MDFEAMDGELGHRMHGAVSPAEGEGAHLMLLARLLLSPDAVDKIRAADTAEQIYAVIARADALSGTDDREETPDSTRCEDHPVTRSLCNSYEIEGECTSSSYIGVGICCLQGPLRRRPRGNHVAEITA